MVSSNNRSTFLVCNRSIKRYYGISFMVWL